MHKQSRTAAFRIQFIQRLLTGSEEFELEESSLLYIERVRRHGIGWSLILARSAKAETTFSDFYRNLFKVWTLFEIPKDCELFVLAVARALTSEPRYSVTEENLLNSGLLTIGQVLQVAGANFSDVIATTEKMAMRSFRLVARALDKWKTALSDKEFKLLLDYLLGLVNPDCTDSFPDLYFIPIMDNCEGCFLEVNNLIVKGSAITSGKVCQNF